jgi:hypothetical protein
MRAVLRIRQEGTGMWKAGSGGCPSAGNSEETAEQLEECAGLQPGNALPEQAVIRATCKIAFRLTLLAISMEFRKWLISEECCSPVKAMSTISAFTGLPYSVNFRLTG